MSNEYISRATVLSDIEQTIENSGCVNHEREIIDCVRYADAADVAPVVRCKDCRFYEVKQSKLCDMHNRAADENDYCSYGVQRKVQE